LPWENRMRPRTIEGLFSTKALAKIIGKFDAS
jgi:hypothetical protein